LKIIQINCTYGNADSTGRNTKEMHRWLLENGYDSMVFASRYNDNSFDDKKVFIYSTSPDRKIHSLLSRITGLQGYFSAKATRKIIGSIKKSENPVVILGVLHNNSINLPLLCKYLAKNNIPTIVVLHDCWFFTGHCCYYSEINCTKWLNNCENCPSMRSWNKSWFFDTAKKCLRDKKRLFDSIERLGVVGVSEWIIGEGKKSILKNALQLQCIYNWIDLDVFKPQEVSQLRERLEIGEKQKVLLGVAAIWNDKKGLQELMLAAKSFPDAKVLLIGNLPQNQELPNNVVSLGVISDQNELAKYYALADVFINPSIQETFGKTTAEAICCGTPVVAYETTACTELVGNERGALVKLGDKSAFIKATQNVLSRGKKEYAEKCRLFAKNNFSKDTNIKAYVDLAEKLL